MQARSTRLLLASALAVFVAASSISADMLTIKQWGLYSTVIDLPDIDGAAFEVVQNPFTQSHQASLPGPPSSLAQTAYDFTWTTDSGTFSITAAHAAAVVTAAVTSICAASDQ